MLLRGQNLLGYRHYADDVVDAFVAKCAENAWHGRLPRLRCAERRAERRGGGPGRLEDGQACPGRISYTISPVHTMDKVDRSREAPRGHGLSLGLHQGHGGPHQALRGRRDGCRGSRKRCRCRSRCIPRHHRHEHRGHGEGRRGRCRHGRCRDFVDESHLRSLRDRIGGRHFRGPGPGHGASISGCSKRLPPTSAACARNTPSSRARCAASMRVS